MAVTTKVSLTSTWTQLTNDGENFVMQSRAIEDIEVIYKATTPIAGELGHIIGNKQANIVSTTGKGITYGRTSNSAVIVITK